MTPTLIAIGIVGLAVMLALVSVLIAWHPKAPTPTTFDGTAMTATYCARHAPRGAARMDLNPEFNWCQHEGYACGEAPTHELAGKITRRTAA